MELIYKKTSLRILPLVGAMYVLCYIDRVNVSFAQLTMGQSLKFSDMVYAMGVGIFFWGYFIFEIPSNLILKRIGAKIWFTRIMISWGVATMALALVKTPMQFYIIRFLVGIAEAGFAPGVIYYLTLWFPGRKMAQALSIFYLGMPISGIIGGPLAGVIIKYMDGVFGLESWQYIFIIEGLLPIIASFAILYFLPSKPQEASWISAEENILLQNELSIKNKTGEKTDWKLISSRIVLSLTAVYFFFSISQFCFIFWLPQVIKSAGIKSNAVASSSTAVIWLFAAISMLFIAKNSDRLKERRWHITVIGILISLCYFSISGLFQNNILIQFIFLSLIGAGICAIVVLFWTIAGSYIKPESLAVMMAFINSIGHLGGYFAPILTAWIKFSCSLKASLFIVGGCSILIVTIIIQTLPWNIKKSPSVD